MPKALVIGANGQDGTFLVRHLLERNYEVVGVSHQKESRWQIASPLFRYVRADLRQPNSILLPLQEYKPDYIFHVAAVHNSAGGDYESKFNDLLSVNVASVHTVLEYQRLHANSHFIYASSAKVFGSPLPDVINEKTAIKNQCLYSISKNTAYNLIDYYRQRHKTSASVVYLFNHESELRPNNFFIPIILNSLASALQDTDHITHINTLNFYCDWGSAEEYMGIMIDILDTLPSEDFVLGTGSCTYARDLVRRLFNDYGLNYERHIVERDGVGDPSVKSYQVDLTKLVASIHKEPHMDIYAICKQILAKEYNI